ncbi:DUF4124 domain-containing protein [Neptuniibacter pectenicola]|uniref:DUF4124 domain-containing protein n=1 Tax=Neptuniibacter pectenicola TaxID=1806669 RepID=UPI0030EE20B6|tara:strand:- start:3279 stop:3821 length:543 start_codon:yes stop_codon:yes gene_type:complete
MATRYQLDEVEMKKRILLCSLIMSLPLCSTADELYRWVDEKGVKHFSNKPPQGAERAAVRGEVNSGALNDRPLNTMQPYTAPVIKAKPAEVDAAPDAVNKEDADTPENAANTDNTNTSGKKDKSKLQSRDQQLEAYNAAANSKEARIKEIEAVKNKDKATPKTLNQKLKAYNDAKTVNQD